jgi:hypothetical protein
MPKASVSLRTNSMARKAKVRSTGTCALCDQPGTFSVVQAKRVKASAKHAQGYTLYCQKHADRKVAIRTARKVSNAGGKKATPKAKATPKRAAKASKANTGSTPQKRRAARQAAAAKAS